MAKLKVNWVTKSHNLEGNAFGYNTHNSAMIKYTEDLIEKTEDSKISLQIAPADFYRHDEKRINVLFTMWEFLELPKSYIENLKKPDVIIVPSSFCKDLFRKYTDKPIYVCWEGVDEQKFKFHQRSYYKGAQKFRFLWVGAPNPRKGYPIVLEAIKVFSNFKQIEIYLKTTAQKIDWEKVEKRLKDNPELKENELFMQVYERRKETKEDIQFSERLIETGVHKNIIFDTRKLPDEELIDLYNSAHAFILPTFGEGWGLTLCEAMATGAPCISLAETGCRDFFNERVGYPLKWKIGKHSLENYDLETDGYVPLTDDFVAKMTYIIGHYDEALKLGKKASEYIREKFTWKKSGERLAQILTEVENDYVNK